MSSSRLSLTKDSSACINSYLRSVRKNTGINSLKRIAFFAVTFLRSKDRKCRIILEARIQIRWSIGSIITSLSLGSIHFPRRRKGGEGMYLNGTRSEKSGKHFVNSYRNAYSPSNCAWNQWYTPGILPQWKDSMYPPPRIGHLKLLVFLLVVNSLFKKVNPSVCPSF